MGMLCSYMMIDEATLVPLLELNNSDLTTKILSLEETGQFQTLGIDKIWDAIHFFLTDESASNPIEGNKLSEAIIGIHNFHYEEDADYIACTENNELIDIIEAMEGLNLKERKKQFNWELMEIKDIYPFGIWETPKENLFDEFHRCFIKLIKFYKSALDRKKHVIISVL